MFQIELAVLLEVESLAFDFPTAVFAAVGNVHDALAGDVPVGQPGAATSASVMP